MSGRALKSIFVVLFLVTNIILLLYTSYTYYMKVHIAPELITKTIAVMERGGVDVSRSLVPSYKEKTTPLLLVNVPDTEKRLTETILGQSLSELKYQSGMYVNDDGAYVILSGGMSVTCGNIAAADTDALSAAEAFVTMLDGKLSSHELISQDDEHGEYVFGQYIDKRAVEGAQLRVKVSSNILSAEGTYIYAPVLPAAENGYSEPLDVMLKFLAQDTKSKEIRSLLLCYIAEKKISASGLRPAYCITDENGYNYYFDAETGERIK
ncbi:MAG: hypothetical protein IJG50_03750 [Clostridia bacterium]|nr:hypothetical protein [Clostridia bacterium]